MDTLIQNIRTECAAELKGARKWWGQMLRDTEGVSHVQYKVLLKKRFPAVTDKLKKAKLCTNLFYRNVIINEIVRCKHPECDNHIKEFDGNNPHGVPREYCSSWCCNHSPLRVESIQATNKERYGHATQFTRPDFWDKVRATNMDRRGVEHHAQDPECQAQTRATNLRKYGAEFIMQVPKFKKKSETTFKRHFKGGHNTRDLDWRDRQKPSTFFKYIEYTTKDGRLIKLQGYEPKMAKFLEDRGYAINASRIMIPYLDRRGRQRYYYPDILAKKGDRKLVVEVKSIYTASGCAPKFKAAKAYCDERGYEYVLVVLFGNNRMYVCSEEDYDGVSEMYELRKTYMKRPRMYKGDMRP